MRYAGLNASLLGGIEPRAAGLAAAAAVAVVAGYFPSFRQMVETWAGSETFSHGFFVVPIAIWLAWRERAVLARVPVRPDARGLAAVLVLGAGWLLGRLAAVDVVSQLCAVGVIVGACWALAGPRVLRALAFPLAFLFLAVPIGEFLVQPLMAFTADFTVVLLRLSGLDVFQQSYYFMTTRGSFEVVKACSGARYLIAMLVLSLLVAKLYFRAPRRRLALVAAAAVAAILLNGVRAYVVVMVAHFSHMRFGAGDEHIVFGWFLFAGLAVAVILVAARLSDADRDAGDASAAQRLEKERSRPDAADAGRPGAKASPAFVAAVLGAIVLGPVLWSVGGFASASSSSAASAPVPAPAPGWAAVPVGGHPPWTPAYHGYAADERTAFQREDGRRVDYYAARYPVQREGAEAVNAANEVFDWRDWARVGEGTIPVELPGPLPLRVDEILISGAAARRLVWRIYLSGDRVTSSEMRVKALNVLDLLTGKPADVTVVIVSTVQRGDVGRDRDLLARFLADHWAALTAARSAAGSAP